MSRKRTTSPRISRRTVGRIGAEGHAHADLLPALRDGEGEHAVDADGREQRREAAERDREHHDQPLGQQRFAELRRQRLQVVDGQLRIEPLHRGAQGGRERRRVAFGAHVEVERAQVRVLKVRDVGEGMRPPR